MSIEQWTATQSDADKGYCAPEQVGETFSGPRPSTPVFWTVWDSLAGRCSPEQVGVPRPPSEGGSRVFPQLVSAPTVSSEEEGAEADATVERLLEQAASLHLQSPEEQRQAQLQYLNLGISALLPRVNAGDRLSMETMVKLQARIASISGLDQPRMKEEATKPTMANIARLTDDELEQIAMGAVVYRDRLPGEVRGGCAAGSVPTRRLHR